MHSWLLFVLGIGLFAFSCCFPIIASKYQNKQVRAYLAITDVMLTFAAIYLSCLGVGSTWGSVAVVFAFIFASQMYFEIMGPDFKPYGIERKSKTKNKNLDQRLVNLNETIQARLEQYPPGKYDDPALWKLLKDMDGIIKEWS